MMKGADPRIIDGPGPTAARLLAVIILGLVVALPLTSRPLATWSDHLPDAFAPLQALAHRWDGGMERLGLTTPYDTIHRQLQQLTG